MVPSLSLSKVRMENPFNFHTHNKHIVIFVLFSNLSLKENTLHDLYIEDMTM